MLVTKLHTKLHQTRKRGHLSARSAGAVFRDVETGCAPAGAFVAVALADDPHIVMGYVDGDERMPAAAAAAQEMEG
jgi:hypothetical protein